MSNKIEAWKAFLHGRIAIERGDIRAGLTAIDEAIRLDPSEETFSRSRTIAENLRSPDKVAAELVADYSHLAKVNVGVNDRPETWIKELEGLLSKADMTSVVGAAW